MNDTRFESCIKCTVCTTTCPVGRVNPRYPGPKQAGLDGERLRLKDSVLYSEALKYCINCKRCEAACPSDMKIGDAIQRAQARYGQQKPTLCGTILSHTDLMGILSTPFAPLVNATTGLKPACHPFDAALKIDYRRILPKYGLSTFRCAYRQLAARQAQYPGQVVFFHGYYVNYNHLQLDKDLIRVVNTLDAGVQLLSKGKCCGMPLITNGFFGKARKQAQNNVAAIRGGTLPIIATSSTCAFTLRGKYSHLLDVNNSDLCDRVELATRWIWKQLDAGKTLPPRQLPLKVVYRTPCHMEKMDWSPYTLELLRLIPDLQLEVLDPQCRGIAGTCGFKTENYVVSRAIGAPLFRQAEESGADVVMTDCETCKWQVKMPTRKHYEHPLTILAQALV